MDLRILMAVIYFTCKPHMNIRTEKKQNAHNLMIDTIHKGVFPPFCFNRKIRNTSVHPTPPNLNGLANLPYVHTKD